MDLTIVVRASSIGTLAVAYNTTAQDIDTETRIFALLLKIKVVTFLPFMTTCSLITML
jgi:hypothetical protein